MSHHFNQGQRVRLRAEPEREGVIIARLPPVAGTPRYSVFHSAEDLKEYFEEQLVAADSSPENEADLSRDEFRNRLTAMRLSHPLTDSLYALHAARIQFIPFQFKPLLRMLRSDLPRILIADEVGVGKTIEAGLIMKELQSRQKLDKVLIVCPKALVTKWRAEMRRFDEDFHALTAESLRYCLRETHLDGEWPDQYSRAIVHLELLRKPEYLDGTQGRHLQQGLTSLDPQPRFSLVIFDEAHHLRNPGTNSHRLAQLLCDSSEAVVLLSATPIQLGSRNLFTLLNLLRPDLFQDEMTFSEMISPNQHLTQAMRHIRSRAPAGEWKSEAAKNLMDVAQTSWGRRVLSQDPRFDQSLKSLDSSADLTDEQRIHCLRDLEEVHTLAHVMNRTRRRDIGRFTIREPHTISVPFTPEQEQFYFSLINFRREVLALSYDQRTIRLITDTLERQAASCLPALIPTLDNFLQTGHFSASAISDTPEEDDEISLPPELQEKAERIRELASRLPPEDPKWDALVHLAEETRSATGPGKMLIFSFFLHTLHYLARKLAQSGYRIGVVTGKVEEEERQMLRDRFRKPRHDPDALDILLSSEVGCEGLDYEFCDRLVNYDIPWNPMRLEQRIGRIDRFGQAAEKVLVFNFVTPGTVEQRIFFRCYDRLGIFRDTIGDCEEVLGEQEVTERLLELVRNPGLTLEQAEEQAQQIADNALRKLEEQRRLEAEGANLLGMDQALMGEIEQMEAEDRIVSATDLQELVSFYVSGADFGGALETDREQPNVCRLRLNREARELIAERLRSQVRNSRATQEFRNWLKGNDPYLLVTFDQQTALSRRDLPFVTPVHPLTQLAVAGLTQPRLPLQTRLGVQSADLPTGMFVFACSLWTTIAARPEVRLLTSVWSIGEEHMVPAVAARFHQLLAKADGQPPGMKLTDNQVKAALARLDEEAYRERQQALAELQARNGLLIQSRLSSLETYHHW